MGQAAGPFSRGAPRAVLIAGPTASGKSALALDLAREVGGVVINADSMQVYADLAIITARPTAEETAAAPHALYGEIDGGDGHSVGRWLVRAAEAIDKAGAAGLIPIVTGGTGLYFKALTTGIAAIPAVPPEVRARVRARAVGLEAPALHAWLSRIDPPAAAMIRPSDPQRILRAVEVFEATGRSLTAFHGEGRGPPVLSPDAAIAVYLAVDRAENNARIDRRFDAMMAAGALGEVERLMARGLDPALPVMRAHGVPGLIAHLSGAATLADAVMKAQADTRAYAKRQDTWFRGQAPDFAALSPAAAADAIRRRLDAGPGA